MMKKYKNIINLGLILFGLSGCVGVSPGGQGYDITVPMGMINSTVAQNFPQSRQTNYGTLNIDKANILGKQGSDKLGVGTTFSFSNMLIPNGVKGEVHFSGGIRYNTRDRGLYLTSPMVDELKFLNFSLSSYITPQMRNMIGDIIAQELMKKPIYNMNTMGASFVKGIGVENGNVVVSVGL
ncbi:MAG: DUF1439 domain-containing protein [Sulfurovum sp.]|nr:DUF1439 domain-containing protein [Sulfurovum sp.]